MIKIIFFLYIFINIENILCFKSSFIDQQTDNQQIEQKTIDDNSEYLEQKVIFGNDEILDYTENFFQKTIDENDFLDKENKEKILKTKQKKLKNEDMFKDEMMIEDDIIKKENEIMEKEIIRKELINKKDKKNEEENMMIKNENKVLENDEGKILEENEKKIFEKDKNLKKDEEKKDYAEKKLSDRKFLNEDRIKKKDKKKKKKKVKNQSSVNNANEESKIDKSKNKNLKNDDENDNFNIKIKKNLISPGVFFKKEKKLKSFEKNYLNEVFYNKQKNLNKLKNYEEIRKIEKLQFDLRMIKDKNLFLIEQLNILEYRCRKNRLIFFDTLWKNTAKKFIKLDNEIDNQLIKINSAYNKISKLLKKKEKSKTVTEKLQNEISTNRINFLNLEKETYDSIKKNKSKIEKVLIIMSDFEKEFLN